MENYEIVGTVMVRGREFTKYAPIGAYRKGANWFESPYNSDFPDDSLVMVAEENVVSVMMGESKAAKAGADIAKAIHDYTEL